MQRRSFVAGLGTLFLPSLAHAQMPLARDPFGLGVASGAPRANSVVLWTRLLAVDPYERLAGTHTVGWSIAEDEKFDKIVRSGEATAEPQTGHSLHVEVDGLKPNRPYWYRFTVQAPGGSKASPVGRTRTAPAAGEQVPALRFSFSSCQQYEQGYYTAMRHMVDEELNAVLFLGDYIYEVSYGRDLVRHHGAGRPTTLGEYRNRYALYKSDANLQAAHAAHPWIVTWDDHEVANDYANDISPTDLDPQAFLKIRAAAYQAYWEHMPLPNAMRPEGASARLFERYRFGDLAEISVLDDRQYRSHNACHAELIRSRVITDCAERDDPRRTMLGAEQEAWFAEGMKRASAKWNVIAQQTLMAELDEGKDGKHSFWADGWDGYPMGRQRFLDAVAASPVKDTLVLGGDVHSFWATDLRRDFTQRASPVVATEFVGGSLTSEPFPWEIIKAFLPNNPHMRYVKSGVFGYGVAELSPKASTVLFRTVQSIKEQSSPISTMAKFTVEAGKPGVVTAS
jgi:alkaline phosphatase D